jgi:hypothetical protein
MQHEIISLRVRCKARYGGACLKPSTQEAEAGGAQIQGQTGLQGKTLSQKQWLNEMWDLKLMSFSSSVT